MKYVSFETTLILFEPQKGGNFEKRDRYLAKGPKKE
jgi:hypothetical protein